VGLGDAEELGELEHLQLFGAGVVPEALHQLLQELRMHGLVPIGPLLDGGAHVPEHPAGCGTARDPSQTPDELLASELEPVGHLVLEREILALPKLVEVGERERQLEQAREVVDEEAHVVAGPDGVGRHAVVHHVLDFLLAGLLPDDMLGRDLDEIPHPVLVRVGVCEQTLDCLVLARMETESSQTVPTIGEDQACGVLLGKALLDQGAHQPLELLDDRLDVLERPSEEGRFQELGHLRRSVEPSEDEAPDLACQEVLIVHPGHHLGGLVLEQHLLDLSSLHLAGDRDPEVAHRVVLRTTRTTGKLPEARAIHELPLSIVALLEVDQLGNHVAEGKVDPDHQGLAADYDVELALEGQLEHQIPLLLGHAAVVHADALRENLLQGVGVVAGLGGQIPGDSGEFHVGG